MLEEDRGVLKIGIDGGVRIQKRCRSGAAERLRTGKAVLDVAEGRGVGQRTADDLRRGREYPGIRTLGQIEHAHRLVVVVLDVEHVRVTVGEAGIDLVANRAQARTCP